MPFYRKESASMKRISGNYTKIDINKTLNTHDYHVPDKYKAAVELAIKVYRSGIPFNRAIDQTAASYKSLNRNTLAKHTLFFIANEY